jgi:hypothetical protein
VTDEDVRKLLRKACDAAGSQRAWADANNVSAPYVSDVLCQRRDPGPAVLSALGLRAETRYVKYYVKQ